MPLTTAMSKMQMVHKGNCEVVKLAMNRKRVCLHRNAAKAMLLLQLQSTAERDGVWRGFLLCTSSWGATSQGMKSSHSVDADPLGWVTTRSYKKSSFSCRGHVSGTEQHC